jgi:hypothetical protein
VCTVSGFTAELSSADFYAPMGEPLRDLARIGPHNAPSSAFHIADDAERVLIAAGRDAERREHYAADRQGWGIPAG